ncbi:MAG: apolipoprotein N-acyltransferase [Verrucomicrobiota bacterium]|jgi:apolipoprotein N-acyltransferase
MPSSEMPSENQIPLVVDLDGTLIKTDLLWESLARLLRRNPFQLLSVLFWWARGRAFLKRQLVRRVKIDPATLPFNEPFLAFLREQKRAGRKLILATASDRQMALPVANHTGLFDEVLGSNGKTNLRGANKLKALTEKFGERGFDYAGNSFADFAVWRGAREAIVVNASAAVLKRAAECAKPGPTFTQDYSPFATLKSFLNELLVRSGYLLATGAGFLLTAAFPKIGIAGCAWIAPAILIAAAYGKRGGDAFCVGYVAGLVHFLSSLYWLLLIPVTGFPILGWAALAMYLALYPAVWVWLVSKCGLRIADCGFESWSERLLWSLSGATIWVALEMVRARLFSGFPWNPLGASQFQLIPLIQIASVTGVYGVSFLVVWVSLSLFSGVRMIFRRPASRMAWQVEILLPLAAVAALFAFGFARINGQNPPSATLRVTLVQPSFPQSLIWDPNANTHRFHQLLELSEKALTNQTDLLIWPESAVPEFDTASYVTITNLACTHHVWLIFNAEDFAWRSGTGTNSEYDAFNAAFLFGPDGRFRRVYHKQNLVIFGEYIPLVRWLPFIKWFTPITGSFASGTNVVPFEMERLPPARLDTKESVQPAETVLGAPDRVKTATLICFEDVFPELAREYVQDDTDFLVNLTNDGWFGEGAAQWQQAAAGVFRAVENGVSLVRCCNNGVTCWADATGRLREIFKDQTGSVYGSGAMTVEIPVGAKREATFYNRHGDWFGWLCVGVTGILLVVKISGQRRRQQP